ncbi:MAG TPA: hypothetical protein H9955_15945 [Candidatus Mediterraneibacter cottocaccae]|nr:hypothetical protein [Candidatus Mediterraneibacter cottocaccae]
MKRLISTILVLVMTAALVTGCSSKTGNTSAATVDGTAEELVEKIIAECPVEFMGATTVLDLSDTSEQGLLTLKSFTGLDSADAITDAAVYEPMIGSIAFSLVLVKTAADADIQDVAQSMKDGVDPRKWICVGADEMQAAGYGNAVMLIMLDSNTGLTSQSFVDAFQNVVGAEPAFVI